MKTVRLITLALAILWLGVVGDRLPAQSSSASPAVALIDINHASAAELRTLPGIGEAYSLAIIKHRPYKNKTQLRSGGVIPLATYNKIRDKIIAKQ